MTTPITKELREHAEENVKALRLAVKQHAFKDIRDAIEMDLKVAEFALAAMDAEPVADVVAWHKEGEERTCDIRWRRFDVAPGPLFAVAPPVMKDHQIRELVNELRDIAVEYHGTQQLRERIARKVRASMLNHSEVDRDMVERVSQHYKLPSQSSDAVNEAAWKLHDTLTEHGPLNGHQFNNLKGCFYEALKVAMCNSPAIPDAWIAVSERMPEMHTPVWCFGSIPEVSGKEFGFEGWLTTGGFVAENNSSSPGCCEKAIVTHWMPLPAAPQHRSRRGSDV